MNSASRSDRPRYSVVVVTYNSRGNIGVCLDSLRRCGGPANGADAGGSHEVIVVDNDSRDGTAEFLASRPDVRAILNTENHGFSKGCNQGAAIARGDYLIFLNPDTLVTPGWSEAMARHFHDPLVGAVGPVSNYVAGLQRLDLNLPAAWRDARSFPGEGAAEIAAGIARILAESNAGKGVPTRLLIGFCLMMPRPLYEAMDGMDENLFLGNDDLDLSWRLRNLGRKLVVATDAFVFHEGQKSFKTRAKDVVDRLTRESTDALYVKLVHHYGGRDKVPAASELWGIGWFNPSPSLLQGGIPALPPHAGLAKNLIKAPMPATLATLPGAASHSAAQPSRNDRNHEPEVLVKTETRETTAWKSVTILIYAGPEPAPVPAVAAAADAAAFTASAADALAARLDRTLATLPARAGVEIVILNCAGMAAVPEAPAHATLRKLDLGSGFPPRQALELALALMPGTHALFCLAGVESSAMFNHWLDKRDPAAFGAALPLPLRIGDGDKDSARGACAFLAEKSWLKDTLAAIPSSEEAGFLSALDERLRAASAQRPAGKPVDPPWLLARESDLPAALRSGGWTPVGPASAASAPSDAIGPTSTIPAHAASAASPVPNADPLLLYPESLRPALREAKAIGFAGTTADPPVRSGSFRALDPKGNLVPISDQDLIILRITADLIEGLSERMANIRRLAPGLKRLIAVFNGADAKRLPPEGVLPAVDLTPEGMRAALWRAGFAVTGEQPYRGFPKGTVEGDDLRGWTQIESVPRRAAYAREKKVSIIILGFNQVEYTRKCIESIRSHTRQAYELILIDNGSRDGTEEYFRSVPGAKVIRNRENLGVARGWNQGMRLATGDYLLILNNDVIVGPDWLENMVRLAESDPSIGLVGPRSNYIAGPQAVPDVTYKADSGIQDFIRKWQEDHALSAAEFRFIKGFCHLIPRRVFEKVGFYDERFGKGNFEDDDYCMRVHVHGYRALFADDCFIHHYGSVSFNQESVDWRALMIENQQKYERKWAQGSAAIHDTFVAAPEQAPASAHPAASSGTGAPAPAGAKGSGRLAEGQAAFESGDTEKARRLFLEAQGENPSDPEPYCSLGVLLYMEGSVQEAVTFFMRCLNLDPSHVDAAQNLLDILAARKAGLDPAAEAVAPEARGAGTPDAEIAALRQRYPSNPAFAAAVNPDAPDSGWTAVPESPNASRAQNATAPQTSMEARTDPSAGLPAWRTEVEALIDARRFAPAMDILEIRIRGNEDAAACDNYLGIIAHACGDAELALKHFTSAWRRAPGETDILFNLSDTLIALGRHAEAAQRLEEAAHGSGVESNPDLPDLAASAEQIRHALSRGRLDGGQLLASRDANQWAERLLRQGSLDEAETFLDAALESDPEDFRALNNKGLLAWYRNDCEAAWKFFQRCLSVRPAWTDALVNAFDAALALGDAARIAPYAANALALAPEHAQAPAIRRHLQSQGLAIHCFRDFEQLEANAARLEKAEKALDQSRRGDAILEYLEALKEQPQNPQVYNGLGIIAFGEKRLADAFGLFDAAAGLHPTDQDILMNLWQCAQALRREGEVLPKLRLSLERNPALEEVKAVVKEYA